MKWTEKNEQEKEEEKTKGGKKAKSRKDGVYAKSALINLFSPNVAADSKRICV